MASGVLGDHLVQSNCESSMSKFTPMVVDSSVLVSLLAG